MFKQPKKALYSYREVSILQKVNLIFWIIHKNAKLSET